MAAASSPLKLTRRSRSRSNPKQVALLQALPQDDYEGSEDAEFAGLGDFADYFRREEAACTLDEPVRLDATFRLADSVQEAGETIGGPPVRRFWQPSPLQSDQMMAAARLDCMMKFGSSNSAFVHGALMMQLLTGRMPAAHKVESLKHSLPSYLQAEAAEMLTQLSNLRGIKLMSCNGGSVVCEAEKAILANLRLNTSQCFYIGISENPARRFSEHQASGYKEMWVYIFPSSQYSGSAEKALIGRVKGHPCCQNRGPGNERASCGEPHFLYIAWRPQICQVIRQ